MSFVIGKEPSKNKIERVEDGTYLARLVQLIDWGVQPQTDWKTGEEKDPQHKLWAVFELPTEMIKIGEEERPRWQGKEYTLSFHEKSGLSALISALDPARKAKTLTELLDKPCMITIGSTSGGNPKIINVVSVPKGMEVPPLQNPHKAFDMSSPDMEVYNSLPDWMKEKITTSLNFKDSELCEVLNSGTSSTESKAEVDYDDDIPF